ncbi:hypothetical protein P5V90_06685 [Mycobacteroides abscessus subsp. abscessus]|uniref:hypothetical protein n=1 Tax=Mycobacteroides abscessus TaxID=36809 RepID=UPI00266C3AC8|nr:hypothetical protein [Mycobacteroides abscessus]MDO3166641.1 hypothetical protein [Mycobacteroides abscessus subsp. abscessus]
MARDPELDRLKAAQDLAFQRKQNAHQVMQRAWERRLAAQKALNGAHDENQRAYAAQDDTWQDYQRIRSFNGPRIDSLKSQQETAYLNMKRAFDNASAAHDRRDGASARTYADEGHRHKADSQRYVAEFRPLIAEIQSAKARHEATKPAFQRTKDQFNRAKQSYEHAKSEHEHAESDFKRLKNAFDQTATEFKKRLYKVRAESKKRNDENCALADKAGVPLQYRDKVWISTNHEGTINLYFGGADKPNGPGHGHYVMDRNGTVTYRRDPFDPHGSQNFEGPGKDGHLGGFGKAMHGWIGDSPVTFALGWGTKEGHTLLADGHLSDGHFRDSRHHDHYGPGDGPNNNGTLRHKYTGPGA